MAYQRWWKTVRDQQGNAVNGASCAVYNGGTGTLATVYDPNTDDSAPGGLANPFVTGANGVFGFMAADGEYDVQVSGGALATQQFRVFLNSAGATIYADLAAPTGAGLVGFDSASSYAAGTLGASVVPKSKTQALFATPERSFGFTPDRAGTADFGIAYGGSSFSGIKDPGMFIGYNADRAAGLTGSATEPEFYQVFESNYWDGTNLMCEWYIHYQSPDRTTVPTFRPIAMTVGRDNNSSKWARIQTDIGTGTATQSVYAILAGPTNLWSYIATQTGTYVPLYIYNSTLNLVSNATANSAINFWNGTPTSKWQHILYQGDNNLYTWDQTNGRFIVKYTAGATNLTAVTEFQSSVKVDGTTTMVQGVLVQGKAFTANGATTTFTYPANTRYQYITTSAASLATTLPATSAALDGAVITLVAGSAVATATWVAGTGGATIVGAPAALVANSPVRMIYHHATTSWYPY